MIIARATIVLVFVVILVAVVHVQTKRYTKWEVDSVRREQLMLPPRNEPKGAYRIIVLLAIAIVSFLLIPL